MIEEASISCLCGAVVYVSVGKAGLETHCPDCESSLAIPALSSLSIDSYERLEAATCKSSVPRFSCAGSIFMVSIVCAFLGLCCAERDRLARIGRLNKQFSSAISRCLAVPNDSSRAAPHLERAIAIFERVRQEYPNSRFADDMASRIRSVATEIADAERQAFSATGDGKLRRSG